jgi:FMN-dependent NADH-azoreductase
MEDGILRKTASLSLLQILVCDHLVIATRVYNYGVPVALRHGSTASCGVLTLGLHCEGLVAGETATVLMASGDVYTEDLPNLDLATQDFRLVFGVIGNTNAIVIASGSARAVDMRATTMRASLRSFRP